MSYHRPRVRRQRWYAIEIRHNGQVSTLPRFATKDHAKRAVQSLRSCNPHLRAGLSTITIVEM